MYIIITFLLGLAIGSFLNAVIFRLHTRENFLKGRSKCPKCHHELSFWDLIPVLSFFFLLGKCRYCKKEISWQYPFVELAAALSFAWLFLEFGFSAQFFVYLIFTSFLIVIFVYDLKYYLILDKVTIPASVLALFAVFWLNSGFKNAGLGVIIGVGFFLLQFIASRGRWIGGGDLRLGLLIGLMLGWPNILVALFMAYILGSLVSVFLLLSRKKGWKDELPLGTFLSIATFVTLIYGDGIVEWYLGLMG